VTVVVHDQHTSHREPRIEVDELVVRRVEPIGVEAQEGYAVGRFNRNGVLDASPHEVQVLPRKAGAGQVRFRLLVRREGQDIATATLQGLADKIASRLPIFIAMVVGLSVLLLMAVFRSLWVPLVSATFNLLSIAAAYGVVVLVFQEGVGASLLGVDGEVPIVSFVPLFMFAILFGLLMDYNVFLQSRIREEYMGGAGPAQSVVRAMARVGSIILAAGVIMTSVFLGFVTDPDAVVKTIGLGLAAAT
jgi:MMPL family